MSKNNTPRCSICMYCENMGRSQVQSRNAGRKHYYCTNPSAQTPSNRAKGFIAFGENTYGSHIQIKTSPRWCPLRENNN